MNGLYRITQSLGNEEYSIRDLPKLARKSMLPGLLKIRLKS